MYRGIAIFHCCIIAMLAKTSFNRLLLLAQLPGVHMVKRTVFVIAGLTFALASTGSADAQIFGNRRAQSQPTTQCHPRVCYPSCARVICSPAGTPMCAPAYGSTPYYPQQTSAYASQSEIDFLRNTVAEQQKKINEHERRLNDAGIK